MFNYLIRRILYTFPILFGVMLLTFFLFFVAQSPETMARIVLGKRATPATVQNWLHNRGYDKPRFINTEAGHPFYDSIFFNTTWKLATFDLGRSDVTNRSLAQQFKDGAVPSVLITLPAFVAGIAVAVGISLYLVLLRNSALDTGGVFACVALMSVPPMVYIIFGQAVIALALDYFPAFGFARGGFGLIRFLLLPVGLMVVMSLGADVRLYRTIFLEEISQDYVRTAYAKGAPVSRVLGVHVLKNGMISLITLTVAHLPTLILGSVLMENFFGIPGLGNALYLAIQTTDFATIRAFVFLGAVLIQIGLIATDICYAIADPRIRLS